MKKSGLSDLKCSYYQSIFMEFSTNNCSDNRFRFQSKFQISSLFERMSVRKGGSLSDGFGQDKIPTLIFQT